MAKRASGGSRAVTRKHRERTAKRPPGYEARSTAAFKAVTPSEPGDLIGAREEALEYVLVAMREAAIDPGPPPEYRREQVGRLAGQVLKGADSQRIISEMGAEYRELAAALEKLRAHRGTQEPEGSAGEPPPGTAQH